MGRLFSRGARTFDKRSFAGAVGGLAASAFAVWASSATAAPPAKNTGRAIESLEVSEKQKWKARFYEELVRPGPTRNTPDFDAYHVGYYSVDKLELARELPVYAARRGRRLTALIVIGPRGSLWSYSVLAFFAEPDGQRVVYLVMPHARIVYEAGGRTPTRNLERIEHAFAGLDSADDGTLDDFERARAGDELAEFTFPLLFVRYGPEARARWLSERKIDDNELRGLDVVDEVIHSLRPRYTHGDLPPSGASRVRMSLQLATLAYRDPLPELSHSLGRAGFSGFNSNALAAGILVAGTFGRSRFETSIMLGFPRDAQRSSDGARATTSDQILLTLGGGYSVFLERDLDAYAGVSLGFSELSLSLPAAAEAGFTNLAGNATDLGQTRFLLGAGLGVDSTLVWLGRRSRLVLSAWLGYAFWLAGSTWEIPPTDPGERTREVDGPSSSSAGLLFRMGIGWGAM